MVEFDVDFIFRMAKGRHGIVKLCQEGAPGVEPPRPATATVWRSRGVIPAQWLAPIVHGLLQRGVPPMDLFCEASR